MSYDVETTVDFEKWLTKLKDKTARARIAIRIDHIQMGHLGDYKPLGDDLFELRFFFGPGFRVYFTIRNSQVVLLLYGGDKSRQDTDIKKARILMAGLEP